MIDFGFRSVELDDQQRFDIQRIAGVHELLDRGDRRAIHDFHAAGNNSGTDDARDTFAGIFRRREADQHRARGFRLLQDAHGHFGDHAEKAFRAVDQTEQIVAGRVEMLAAETQHFAGYQHDLAAQYIVGGHSVFEAMHAAGIFRDIAADRAGDLRGRIGRVVKTRIRHGIADREIGDARLDHSDAVIEIDFTDSIELGHAKQHAIVERQRAAGQRRAGPARHDLDAFVVAIAQDFGDLLGGRRQHHHHRQLPIGGEPVALVGAHLALGRDYSLARDDGPQRSNDALAAAQDRLVCLRHSHRHCGSLPVACFHVPTQRYQPFDGLHIGLAKPTGNRASPTGVGSGAA